MNGKILKRRDCLELALFMFFVLSCLHVIGVVIHMETPFQGEQNVILTNAIGM